MPAQTPFSQTYFHGTKADLKIGDLIETGINSNYGRNNKAKYIYLTATLDAGEVTKWQGHSPEQVKAMKEGLAKLAEQGIEAIED